jgi:hypothetical protein
MSQTNVSGVTDVTNETHSVHAPDGVSAVPINYKNVI